MLPRSAAAISSTTARARPATAPYTKASQRIHDARPRIRTAPTAASSTRPSGEVGTEGETSSVTTVDTCLGHHRIPGGGTGAALGEGLRGAMPPAVRLRNERF